jgi:hypothetical protein
VIIKDQRSTTLDHSSRHEAWGGVLLRAMEPPERHLGSWQSLRMSDVGKTGGPRWVNTVGCQRPGCWA